MQKKGKLYTIKVIQLTFYVALFYPYEYTANLIAVRKSDLKNFQDKSFVQIEQSFLLFTNNTFILK